MTSMHDLEHSKQDQQPYDRRSGFSMIELTLALMIVALGILVVAGLFPSGIKASGLAKEDTVAAMFARDAFSAMHAEVRNMNSNEWSNLSSQTIPMADSGWANSPGPLILDGSQQTRVYEVNLAEAGTVKNHGLRYRVDIDDFGGSNMYQGVTLTVWGSEYGGLQRTYYTEVIRLRME